MQAGWERWQTLDNSSLGKEKRWGALPQPPWVSKCLSLSPARDQGAEHRCAGRRVKAVSACERNRGARVTAQHPPTPNASVQRRVWVRVGWMDIQARVLSTGLLALLARLLPSAALARRIAGHFPITRGKPAFSTREGWCGRFSGASKRGRHGLHPVWSRWLDRMARLLEDLTPTRKEMALSS